jgi:hypothetical protein
MPANLRLTWRLQRFELVVLVGVCLALAAGCAVVAWQLGGAQAELEACYRGAPDSAAAGWPCRAIDGRVNQLTNISMILTGIATAAPFLVGIFLGAPLVAREIERRTSSLAWSLSPSRGKWLALRALPLMGTVLVVLLILGQASETVIMATPPGEIDFRHFAMHGPLLAVRGLAVLGIGLLIGTILGRSLPAILVAGFVTVAIFTGLHLVRYELMRAEAVWVDPQQGGWSITYVHESGFRADDTGEIMGFEEAFERYPEVFAEEQGDQIPPGTAMVFRVNPPEQYPGFVLREAAALAAIGAATGGLTLAVVRVRRPT